MGNFFGSFSKSTKNRVKNWPEIEPPDATLKPPDANQDFDVNLLMPLYYCEQRE